MEKVQQHLTVPDSLNRNAPGVRRVPPEESGQVLIELMMDRCGISDLSDINILDVGCGVRFAQTIINRAIPVGRYCGVDVSSEVISFLKENVEDDRFEFHHLDLYNEMYNRNGTPLTLQYHLPFTTKFDVICAFSLFTHMSPDDSSSYFHIFRRHIKADGCLFFSCFISDEVGDFEDRIPGKPLLNAYYSESHMRSLLINSDWFVESVEPPGRFIQHSFACRPARGA